MKGIALILLAAGLSFQSARRLSKSLPERLPMVVALPDDTSAAIRPEIDLEISPDEAMVGQ